jgi:hypothetical protein
MLRMAILLQGQTLDKSVSMRDGFVMTIVWHLKITLNSEIMKRSKAKFSKKDI